MHVASWISFSTFVAPTFTFPFPSVELNAIFPIVPARLPTDDGGVSTLAIAPHDTAMLDGPLEMPDESDSPLPCFTWASISMSTAFDLPATGKLTALPFALLVADDASLSLVRLWNKLRELREELVLGLTSGWLSKICTCRACLVFTESAFVRFGI